MPFTLTFVSTFTVPRVDLTPFEMDRGTHQQRFAVEEPEEGSYAFEIGHAGNASARLAEGDGFEIYQDAAMPSYLHLIRADIRLVEPEELPAGLEWEIQGYLNSTKLYERRVRANDRIVRLSDIAISLRESLRPTPDRVLFRLAVVSAPVPPPPP